MNIKQKILKNTFKTFTKAELSRIDLHQKLYYSYVLRKGGLVTILMGLPFSTRMERQIHGRSARKDEPGSVFSFYSEDDVNLMNSGIKGWKLQVAKSLLNRRYRT